MDVVELVPSVSFSPRTNLYGRMSGDVTFKVIVVVCQKGNRDLRPHQPGNDSKQGGLRGLVGSAQFE